MTIKAPTPTQPSDGRNYIGGPSGDKAGGDARLDGVEATAEAVPAGEPDVMTVDETAALLRVNRKTVYHSISDGTLPGVRRVGRSFRVSRRAILRWLDEGQGRVPRSRRRSG